MVIHYAGFAKLLQDLGALPNERVDLPLPRGRYASHGSYLLLEKIAVVLTDELELVLDWVPAKDLAEREAVVDGVVAYDLGDAHRAPA